MLILAPILVWLAAGASAVLIVMLWSSGDLGPRGFAVAAAWLLAAGYCQFSATSPLVSAIGLALQTLLAAGLIIRWRFAA
jgi:hypothetical protein